MFVVCLLFFPSGGNKISALTSKCKIDQSDFTDWMAFLISNIMTEEITPYPEVSTANTERILSAWNSLNLERQKLYRFECFNIARWKAYVGNTYTNKSRK